MGTLDHNLLWFLTSAKLKRSVMFFTKRRTNNLMIGVSQDTKKFSCIFFCKLTYYISILDVGSFSK